MSATIETADLEAIRLRWKLGTGQGPDDVRALLAEVDLLEVQRRKSEALRHLTEVDRDIWQARVVEMGATLDRLRALLDDSFITDDGVEVVHVSDVEAVVGRAA